MTWRDAFREARAVIDDTRGASTFLSVLLWLALVTLSIAAAREFLQ